MATTLPELRTAVRRLADLEDDGRFVSDAELNEWLRDAMAELYDLIVQSEAGDFAVKTVSFPAGGAEQFQVPDDFYLLRGVSLKIDGREIPLRRATFDEAVRDRGSEASLATHRYRLIGTAMGVGAVGTWPGFILIAPPPPAGSTVVLYYVPLPDLPTDDDDAIPEFGRWMEYVVVEAAIRCKVKEEADPTALVVRKRQIEERLKGLAASMDAGKPDRVVDVEGLF